MKDEHFIGVYDNALSKDTCNKIIKYFDRTYKDPNDETKSPELKTSRGFDETQNGGFSRLDYQIFLNPTNSVFKLISSCVDKCWDFYREKYWVIDGVFMNFEEVKLQKTPPRGGFHDWHCETNSLEVVDRCMVWMLYLNDIPQGEGETEFLWQGIRVQPKAGRMLIWPAFFTHTHRGNAVYSKSKYIATGWGHYQSDDKDLKDYYTWDEETKNYTGRKY